MKNIQETTISRIEKSDKNCSTDVVDVIHLTDGTTISAWNGNASYCVYDKAKGKVEVGASLVSVEDRESYHGEPYKVYVFA
jgi:hypothetical protein